MANQNDVIYYLKENGDKTYSPLPNTFGNHEDDLVVGDLNGEIRAERIRLRIGDFVAIANGVIEILPKNKYVYITSAELQRVVGD